MEATPLAERVELIHGSCNARDALSLARSLTGIEDARIEREVIYPYHCFDAQCRAPLATGRKGIGTRCLVDAVNGLAATADEFELHQVVLPSSTIMTATIDDEHARRMAERRVTHALGRAFRAIADFRVELHHRGLVHKRFWVISSGEARLLVDSTTAGWTPLKQRADGGEAGGRKRPGVRPRAALPGS
jgi:hypothetical protein